ncbi:unnamed protein product [Ixodes pacificus]
MCRTPGDVSIARGSTIVPRAAGPRPRAPTAVRTITRRTTAQTHHTASTAANHTPLTLVHVKNGKNKKGVITLKVKENISFPEARKRLSFLQKGSFATVTRTGGVSPKTSVGTQVCPKDLAAPPTPPAPPRSAPRPRLSLEPIGSQCLNGAAAPLLKEAMDTMAPKEVSTPKASGMVPLAPPSGPKEGPSQTTCSKELERTPSSSARRSGRGRALPTPASTSSRKPGQLDEAYSPASQQSVDKMMDESVSPSDDDLLPSGAESSVPFQVVEKKRKINLLEFCPQRDRSPFSNET